MGVSKVLDDGHGVKRKHPHGDVQCKKVDERIQNTKSR